MTSSTRKFACMFRIKFRTKRIFRIFPILRTDGMAPFCNLFMERPSYMYSIDLCIMYCGCTALLTFCNWHTTSALYYCLSNALHSSIGENIKSHLCPGAVIQCPVSVLRPECEKLQMAITQQHVIRYTSCLVLGWGF